jgi:non-homologous end joining protein Ku
MLTTMRFADELRSGEDLQLPTGTEHPKKEMDLAVELVEALADDWNPAAGTPTGRRCGS